MIGRRGFITGLVSLVAAPAIVRVGSIMPVRVMPAEFEFCESTIYQMPYTTAHAAFLEAELAAIRERINQAFLYPLTDAAWRELTR